MHRDTLIGRCAPTTGITPFADLVTKVMTREPYAWARRVLWIVDKGSSYRGHASVDRMAKAWPTATRIHLPVHASLQSQVEICSSIVQRKVLTTNDFLDLADVMARLEAFEDQLQLHRQALQLEVEQEGGHGCSHNHRNQVTSRSPRWPVASGEVD